MEVHCSFGQEQPANPKQFQVTLFDVYAKPPTGSLLAYDAMENRDDPFDFYGIGEKGSSRYEGSVGPWARDRYMPNIKSFLPVEKLPFNFTDIIGAIAPRPPEACQFIDNYFGFVPTKKIDFE